MPPTPNAASPAPAAPSLPAATALGPVRLTVVDLAGTSAFYERAIGLHPIGGDADAGEVALGTRAGAPLVELVGRAGAAPRPRRSSGLFHLALLFPSRTDLALALRRVALARHPLEGASDHLVSEALYLSDPEGNGIELYRDRPRAEWGREADGQIRMATLPLDIDDLLGALPDGLAAEAPDAGAPDGTVMGHVHLQVADIPQAEAFYSGVLGFDVVVRGYPGALFVSAGGYHHHLGLNTWGSQGGAPNEPGTRGLDRFAIALPSAADVAAAGERLAANGTPGTALPGGALEARDPFGNVLRLTAAAERAPA